MINDDDKYVKWKEERKMWEVRDGEREGDWEIVG